MRFIRPIFCLTLGFVFSAAAQPPDLWTASNESLEIAVNKKTGTVQRLVDKISKEDYCNQTVHGAVPGRDFVVGERIVGIAVFDELAQREFSDVRETASISAWQAKPGSLSFKKKYAGAEFVVNETYTVLPDHIRWDVKIVKTAGRDRTLRVVQMTPLPLGGYQGWAPIANAPFGIKPYTPFAIEYGQSTAGSVGERRWRTLIPTMVFYSDKEARGPTTDDEPTAAAGPVRAAQRAIAFTHPFEVPAVRIRLMNNTSAAADFHWNSRKYPPAERPYFQVVNEYLGLRSNKDVETSLLISSHPADWRPALGWIYEKYRDYFDPDPNFDRWDGNYVIGHGPWKDSYSGADKREILTGMRDRGVLWEEQHGHFPWYGLMIPKPDVKSWVSESHNLPGYTNTRERIAAHARLAKEYGIGTFIYYNITEAEHWYAGKEFPENIAKDEDGRSIGAFRAAEYPDNRSCFLMNADPASRFGKHMIDQAREMVEAYPAIAGFFWDVYGRSYMFDFAHDDGITMVNNKPAYYPEFMFQRQMRDHIGPMLRAKGMCITANKPTTIADCRGVDGIMAEEHTPDEELADWIPATSFTGLNRHVMVLDGQSGMRAELLLLTCLRYGMFHSDIGTRGGRRELPPETIAANAELARRYLPFIQRFRGKKWVFHPRALELPKNVDGNIFRLKDGGAIITMVSAWRNLRNVEGFDRDLKVVARLPDADRLTHIYVSSIDGGRAWKVQPQRNGDAITITVPQHGRGSAIVLAAQPDAALEGIVASD
ncbi:MAG: hypothetical protein KIT09_21940 [Bryobacteraceae bacterium]|nr:hypothetical protein [Bryobacteraceae bacterium]